MTYGSLLGPAMLLAGRLMLAWIFVHEGMLKLGAYDRAVRYAEAFGVPGATLPAAIAVEIGCGLLIALGLFTRSAAVVLALFCVATAMIFHAKLSETNQLLHFEKNIAIAGGFLVLAVHGAGPWSIERLWRRET